MAKTFKGIAGNLAEQRVHLRDSRHAADNFGLNKAYMGHGTPRHKFQFFLEFGFNNDVYVKEHVEKFLDREDQRFVTAMVKSVDLPSMSIDTETINQYNRRRVSQTKIKYEPVTITFHDTVDGKTLRLWEMYYEYYFRDGVAPEKLKSSRRREPQKFPEGLPTHEIEDNFGYHLQRVGNQKYLMKSLAIYQVHGGHFTRIELVNPRISNFKHDTLDYSATTDLVEMQMTFEYESVIYSNVNEQLKSEELDRYARGDFWEMASLITIRNNVAGRDIEGQARFPKVASVISNLDTPEEEPDNTFFGRLSRRVTQRVTGALQDVVESIPEAIGSAVSTSIFGGKFELVPDPIKAAKTSLNAAGRDIINSSRRELTSALSDTAEGILSSVGSAVVTTAGSIFKKGEEQEEEEDTGEEEEVVEDVGGTTGGLDGDGPASP